jgi:hypothetical protein
MWLFLEPSLRNSTLLYPRSTGGRVYCFTSFHPSIHPRYFSSHFSQQLLMAEIWYKMNCELMLTYDTPAYRFNVYKNHLSRQTGSRNPTGPKTLPTIWHTYMKLVTKYQIIITWPPTLLNLTSPHYQHIFNWTSADHPYKKKWISCKTHMNFFRYIISISCA